MRAAVACAFLGLLGACTTAGSAWMAEPLAGYDEPLTAETELDARGFGGKSGRTVQRRTIVLGERDADAEVGSSERPAALDDGSPALVLGGVNPGAGIALPGDGRSLGVFRNTYYDFPSESDFGGAKVALMSARCETVREVPRGFYESVCVQGSGKLASGRTVSFSRRNCACAEVCPRTGERICFDALDSDKYPFGRGATGRAITPLYTVAVDSEVVPLGTLLYVPEFRGLPRGNDGEKHDGCFLAEDRGVRVKGKQIDVFTGDPRVTALYNRLVPSNRGVTLVVGSSRCRKRESR